MPSYEQLSKNPYVDALNKRNQGMDFNKPTKESVSDKMMEGDPSGGKFQEFSNATPGQVPGIQTPKYPDYSSTLKKQVGDYRQFEKNRSALSDEQFNPYAAMARRDLAGSIKKVRNDYNSRGLLGSGMQKAGEIGERNAANEALARKRSDINQGLLDQQRNMEASIFNTSQAIAQPGINTGQPYLQKVQTDLAAQIEDDAASQELINSIISGGAGAAGYGLAQSMQNNGNTISGYNPWKPYAGNTPGPWSL